LKILYAIQGTGNGHMSRAQVFIPLLKKYGEVDVLISSTDHDIKLSHPIKYKHTGLGFTFGKNGGINYWKSFWRFKILTFFLDMIRFPIKDYDVIINDFEPLTAWLCKIKGKKIVSLSHHSSYLSKLVPRPAKKNWFNEMVLKYHSPCTAYYSFHFNEYDKNIYKPIIREKIREGNKSATKSVLVYLPSYEAKKLIPLFSSIIDYTFNIFCKHTSSSYSVNNVTVFTISEENYIDKLLSCTGIICNAGFETPAEAIYLGKKLLCIPMKGQYEQRCNAEALKQMGVKVTNNIDDNFTQEIMSWLDNSDIIQEKYSDRNEEIIASIINNFK